MGISIYTNLQYLQKKVFPKKANVQQINWNCIGGL